MTPRPCHYRAIHSSRDRSRADTHGQCHRDRGLRRLSSDQVAIILVLALQAGVVGSSPIISTTSTNLLLSRGADGPSLG